MTALDEAAKALGIKWFVIGSWMRDAGWIAQVDKGVYRTTYGARLAGYLVPVIEKRQQGSRPPINVEVSYRITPAGLALLRQALCE